MTDRQRYDKEFKKQAVAFYQSRQELMNSIADELGIPHSTFSRWCLQNQKHMASAHRIYTGLKPSRLIEWGFIINLITYEIPVSTFLLQVHQRKSKR